MEIIDEDGWEEEKKDNDLVIKSKYGPDGRKIWLCVAIVNVGPQLLEKKLLDIENLPKWNTTVTEARTLKTISKDMFITYKVTAEGAGGLVSARDFTYGAKYIRKNKK